MTCQLLFVFSVLLGLYCTACSEQGVKVGGADSESSAEGGEPWTPPDIKDTTHVLKDGVPYAIKGALLVGDSVPSIELLKELKDAGANSVHVIYGERTKEVLDRVEEVGLTATVSLHEGIYSTDVDYSDASQAEKIYDTVIEQYNSLKNNEAVYIWSIGYTNDWEENLNTDVFDLINSIAEYIHVNDSGAYVATTLYPGRPSTLRYIDKNCDAVDVLAIEGFEILSEQLDTLIHGISKPILVSAFSSDGWWNLNGYKGITVPEETDLYVKQLAERYALIEGLGDRVIGSYVAYWGNGSNWWEFYDDSGRQTPFVDEMTKRWSGEYPENRAPIISSVTVNGTNAQGGAMVNLAGSNIIHILSEDSDDDAILYDWSVALANRDDPENIIWDTVLVVSDTAESLNISFDTKGEYLLNVWAHDGKKSDNRKFILSADTLIESTSDGAISVTIEENDSGYVLHRDGKPYVIKGAGASEYPKFFHTYGGNSVRNWGVGPDTDQYLNQAYKNDISVMQGIWVPHDYPEKWFDYDDSLQVNEEFERIKAVVEKHKNHPALLIWGVGNEIENEMQASSVGYDGFNTKAWKFVNDVAAMIHTVDPHHPVATVIAGVSCEKIEDLIEYAPSLDILGINSYAGLSHSLDQYEDCGWNKPVIVTEFGHNMTFEVGQTKNGMPIEATSKEKAEKYTAQYALISESNNMLGSYTFVWSIFTDMYEKWYSMIPSENGSSEIADEHTKQWTGSYPDHRSPSVSSVSVDGYTSSKKKLFRKNTTYSAEVNYENHSGDVLRFEWSLFFDDNIEVYSSISGNTPVPARKGEISVSEDDGDTISFAISESGYYKLVCMVYDSKGNVGYGNVQFGIE